MKKSILLVLSLLLVFSVGVVSQAQDETGSEQTILELAQSTDDLSILVDAVTAADASIAETLGGDGQYTVFAPSNQAFANLLATLDIEADALLENPFLTDILRYHVVDGEYFAEDLTALDGDFAGTFLPDNYVAVSVSDDGSIVLNDIVTVVTADIDASNGVVHVIDEVLLPQIALEAFGLVDAQNTNVQVLHFSLDAPNVDIYVDGEIAVNNLGFGENTGYMTLLAGDYDIAVAPAGTSIDDAVIGPVTVTLNAGEFVNIAAIGSVEAGTLNIAMFNQAFPTLGDDEFGLTVFHATESAPGVDVVLDDAIVIDNLAYPGTQGDNDGAFSLVATTPFDTLTVNNEDTVLLDLSTSGLEAGSYYLVVVGGTADAPMPYVFPITPDRVNELSDALYGNMSLEGEVDMEAELTPEATQDMSIMPEGTIAEIVTTRASAGDAEFTILLAAIENADPAVLDTLQNTPGLTVFAPTDQAFNNLMSATGMSSDELLESDLLTDLLLYHVVIGELSSDMIVDLDDELIPTMLEDTYIGVTVADDGTVSLNEVVGLVQTDVPATNGVIHVIDDVLLPQAILDDLGL